MKKIVSIALAILFYNNLLFALEVCEIEALESHKNFFAASQKVSAIIDKKYTILKKEAKLKLEETPKVILKYMIQYSKILEKVGKNEQGCELTLRNPKYHECMKKVNQDHRKCEDCKYYKCMKNAVWDQGLKEINNLLPNLIKDINQGTN